MTAPPSDRDLVVVGASAGGIEARSRGKLTLRRAPTDLVALVGQVVASTESLAGRKTLRLTLPSEPLIVEGDPVRLEQVLLNLIANAIEHAPDTDAIDVTLRAGGDYTSGPAGDQAPHRGGDYALLEVRDYGPGIPPAEIGQIFSRFRQVSQGRHARSRGLGLGLHIAHEIVTEHGGTIGVDSTEGQGASFYVHLPLLPDPPRI